MQGILTRAVFIATFTAMSGLGAQASASNDYEAVCRQNGEVYEGKTHTEEEVGICVCSYEYMESQIGAQRTNYLVQFLLTGKEFEEITSELTWAEMLQHVEDLGPEAAARCRQL